MNNKVILSVEAVEDVLHIAMASQSEATVIDASRRLYETLMQEPDVAAWKVWSSLHGLQEALRQGPDVAGSHLSEGLYFIDREPLRAFYTKSDEQATVEIVCVKQL